jgi:hypothetical protein
MLGKWFRGRPSFPRAFPEPVPRCLCDLSACGYIGVIDENGLAYLWVEDFVAQIIVT